MNESYIGITYKIEDIKEDSPPNASPMHCKPMHTPNKGTIGPSSNMVCNDIPESWGAPTKKKYGLKKNLMWVDPFFPIVGSL